MNIPWPDSRCILCKTDAKLLPSGRLSEEHIVPNVLGGNLTCNFLCKCCNELMGQFEAGLKEDPSIRLAVENLRSQIPDLYESLSKRQPFVGNSARGPVEGYYVQRQSGSSREFVVRASAEPDGSLILPTKDARHAVAKSLTKEGFSPAVVDEALARFDAVKENSRTELVPGCDISRWSITEVQPKLDSRRLLTNIDQSGREYLAGAGIILLKIAFEYLAIHIDTTVYEPLLDPIRDALMSNRLDKCLHVVESLNGRKLEPFHGLILERPAPHLIMQIRFFGELVYRVHLPGLRANEMTRAKYTHDLTTGAEKVIEVTGA